MIRSERNMAIIVIENDKNLLLNIYGANIATASIGVKFGGWGISLDKVAIIINKKINWVFLNFKFQCNYGD